MTRIIPFIAGFVVATGLVFSSLFVFAQSDVLARFSPFVIDVSQSVPVEVSVPVVEDGETVSKTVPLTVSVVLQVRVDGPQVATVQVMEEPTPVVVVATATKAPATVAASGGEVIKVGEVSWQLIEAESLGQTLKSDNAFINDLTTKAQFIRIKFMMENSGKETITYTGINLVDADGRSYKPSSDAIMLIANDEQCILEQINPGITRHCTVVYEVSADATGIQIQFSDLNMFNGKTQNVDVGLQ